VSNPSASLGEIKDWALAFKERQLNTLIYALKRPRQYHLAITAMSVQENRMFYLKIFLSFLTTLFTTLSATILVNEGTSTAGQVNIALNSMSSSEAFVYISTIVLPVLLSIVTSLRQDLRYDSKILALKYAAAEIKSEISHYMMKTFGYNLKVDSEDESQDTFFESSDAKHDTRLAEKLKVVANKLERFQILRKKKQSDAETKNARFRCCPGIKWLRFQWLRLRKNLIPLEESEFDSDDDEDFEKDLITINKHTCAGDAYVKQRLEKEMHR
jgi:hypothetical protein